MEFRHLLINLFSNARCAHMGLDEMESCVVIRDELVNMAQPETRIQLDRVGLRW